MTVTTKLLIFLGATLLIGGLLFIAYQQHELKVQQTAIESNVVDQKQLVDNIVRAKDTWATKGDLDNFANANNVNIKAIQDDLSKLNAHVDGIDVAVSNSRGQNANNVPSTNVTPRDAGADAGPTGLVTVTCPNGGVVPCPDPYGYQHNTQNLALDEKFDSKNVPIGSVSFSAWQQAPWGIKIYPRQYKMTTVVGKDDHSREYAYNKLTVSSNGKDYDVPIDQANYKQEYPAPKFTLFNPRLNLSLYGGANFSAPRADVAPTLGLAVASLGQYLDTPDWQFLILQAGYAINSGKFLFGVTPFSYSVGQYIPFSRNIQIGPILGLDTAGSFYGMVGISVGL